MAHGTCSVPGCGKVGRLARGWCAKHYSRWRNHGTLEDPTPSLASLGPRSCIVPGCEKTSRISRLQLCVMHEDRLRTHGTTDDPRPAPEARFWAKVNKNGPLPSYYPELGHCWIWTGNLNTLGYGSFIISDTGRNTGRRVRAVRVAHLWGYERYVGIVPDGLELDHLCRVRSCVNFESHLEPVSHRENVLRGESPAAQHALQTHCIRGHMFTSENTYIVARNGARRCRECQRMRDRKRYWRRVAA